MAFPLTPFGKAVGEAFGSRSQRDVVVLLGEPRLGFVLERPKESGDTFPCVPWTDDLFDDSKPGGEIGVVELLLVRTDQFGPFGGRVGRRGELPAVDDIARP